MGSVFSAIVPSASDTASASQLALQVLQLQLFRKGFKKYRGIVGDLADDAEERAEESFKAYETLRAKDVEFFEYYCNLPDYKICDSNILRSKGVSWRVYGDELRRTNKAVRGYTPLARVGISQSLGRKAIEQSAVRRVSTYSRELARVDEHILNRWDAIIASSTNASTPVSTASVIRASFKTLNAYASGANASQLAIGSIIGRFTFGDNANGDSKSSAS